MKYLSVKTYFYTDFWDVILQAEATKICSLLNLTGDYSASLLLNLFKI